MSLTYKKTKLVLFILVLLSLLFSLVILAKPMQTLDIDAYSRVVNAVIIFNQNKIYNFYHDTWLPFHQSIIILSLHLYSSPYISLRVITLISSSLSIVSLYLFTNNLIKNRLIGIIATTLFTIFPLRIFLSTITLSEPIFLFFLISSLAILIKKNPNHFLWLLLLNIAHGIRYESWFILPFIWLFIALSYKLNLFKKILLIFFSTLVPQLWLIQQKVFYNDAFYFFKVKYLYAQGKLISSYSNFNLSFTNWNNQLANTIPFFFTLIYFYGLFIYFKSNQSHNKKIISIIPIFLFFSLVIQVYLGSMEWFPARLLYTCIALGIPIISLGLHALFTSLKKYFPSYLLFSLTIIGLYLIYPSVYKTFYNSRYMHLTGFPIEKKDVLDIISFLDKVDITQVNYYSNSSSRSFDDFIIAYYTQIPVNVLTYDINNFTPSSNPKYLSIIEKKSISTNQILDMLPEPLYQNQSYIITQ
jgi:hypothetical protein